MTIRTTAAGVVIAMVLTGGGIRAQTKGAGEEVRAAIEAVVKRTFIDGFQKNDAAMIASAYTDDAIAYPPNAEPVRGRSGLQGLWKSLLDSGIAAAELTTTEVDSAGDLAYETGNYVLKTKDGTVADRGKYIVVWKRVKGDWLMHRDIWNSSMPVK